MESFNYEQFLVVVGLQHGDEAKGRFCDALMSQYDACVRYSGGGNTGASVWVNGKLYKFHHLPVSLLQGKRAFIASACLLNLDKLREEIETYKNMGIDVDNLLKISPDCHIVTSDHVARDVFIESTESQVGSTKRGIGPCASDKYGRTGTRIESIPEFEKYFADIGQLVLECRNNGENVMFESSQGTLLDIDHGLTYPNISTSSNIAASACVSCGFAPYLIDSVLGVFKPYVSKVGTGPFPTEILDKTINDQIVEKGSEYGTTTGRRRKVGWLDLPALKYAINRNGCSSLAMAKIDVIQNMDIKICVAYKLHGNITKDIPVKKTDIQKLEPIYIDVKNAQIGNVVNIIESYLNIPIKYISLGKERNDLIERDT